VHEEANDMMKKRLQDVPSRSPGYSVLTEILAHLQSEEEEVDHLLSSVRLGPALDEKVQPELGISIGDYGHSAANERDCTPGEAIDYSYILSTWNSAGVTNPGQGKPDFEFDGDDAEAVINRGDNSDQQNEMRDNPLYDDSNNGMIILMQDAEPTISIEDIEILRNEIYQTYLEETCSKRKITARFLGIKIDRIIQYFQHSLKHLFGI